jgi:hypothetical protein
MPTNHGIYRKRIENAPSGTKLGPEQVGIFRHGIWQIFNALKMAAITPSLDEQKKAVQLEFHYRETIQRLAFSLQHVSGLMQEMAAGFNNRASPMASKSVGLAAGCHADHILTYLNSIVDDIACAIVHATGFVSSGREIDSMGLLKGTSAAPALAPVKALVDELGDVGSWWELAFAPRVGGRQLLIHNHYYVTFQGSATEGQPFEAHTFLMTPFARTALPHFFDMLRSIFAGLFNWLDRLEAALTALLRAKCLTWAPNARCPSFTLPIGYPPGTTHFLAGYSVLPLCDGSDPLPWTTNVRMA